MYLLHYKCHIEQLRKRYTLVRLLGSGNIADVYLVWDEWERHEAVVKVIRPDVLDPAVQERFLREGKIIASLNHRHIVRSYEGCAQKEIFPNPEPLSIDKYVVTYIVMEYIRGGDLEKRFAPGRPLPLDEIARVFEQLCTAVQYAHSQGVIHRDIKPSNILFREHPLEGDQVVLSDFDLALQAHDPHNLLSEVGTSVYMAPEQRQGNPQLASDIYSLGVVLYQLCTGQSYSLSQTPTKPTLLNPSLPLELDDVILHALSNEPSQRFASASLLWQAIQSAVGQIPLPQSNKEPLKVEQPGTRPLLGEPSSAESAKSLHEISSTTSMLPIEIFISHSHSETDMWLLTKCILPHLSPLARSDPSISHWDGSKISIGDEFAQEINKRLSRAGIILLMVSPDYFAESGCYAEMEKALEIQRRGKTCVIPVILRPTFLEDTPLNRLEALPAGGKPITMWKDADVAGLDIVKGIARVIKELRNTSSN